MIAIWLIVTLQRQEPHTLYSMHYLLVLVQYSCYLPLRLQYYYLEKIQNSFALSSHYFPLVLIISNECNWLPKPFNLSALYNLSNITVVHSTKHAKNVFLKSVSIQSQERFICR